MANQQMTTRNNNNREYNVPVQNAPRDFHTALWNMFDFPHFGNDDMEPKIEVANNKNDITVTAEIPGVAEEDIDVEISSDGYLTISGEKRNEHEENSEGSYFSEISYGMVRRTIPLPTDLKFEAADAEYADGVLRIEIPKSEAAQQKRKKINVSHNANGGRRNKKRNKNAGANNSNNNR